jgi:hypothetical protein
MLVFREYAGHEDLQKTIDCLRMATGCLELRLDQARVAAAEAAAERRSRDAQRARELERAAAAAAARPNRKRGRPAKDPARVRDVGDPAALSLEEARALEARRDAARADAARQQDAAGSPLLFADPPPLAAAD